jgi:hypothetical protein
MDGKQFLLEYFDKIALGVAGLALVVLVGAPLVQSSEADAHRDQVKQYNKAIGALRNAVEDADLRPERLNQVREVQRALSGGTNPEAWPTWLMHKRVRIACRRIGIVIPDPPEHYAPMDLSGSGGLGAISIQWADNPRNRLVKIVGFRVERNAESAAAEEGWKVIGSVGGAVHSFRDTQELEPGRAYWYRVIGRASEDQGMSVVRKYDLQLADDQRELVSVATGPFSTQPEVYVDVQSVRIKEVQGGQIVDPLAYMKVYKFVESQGRWSNSGLLTVKVGGRVGTVENPVPGAVDYTTDWVLVNTRRRTRKREISPGNEITEEVDVVILRHVRTGDEIEVTNKDQDEALERIKSDPTYGTEQSDGDGDGDGEGQ